MPAPRSIPVDIHHPSIGHCFRPIPGRTPGRSPSQFAEQEANYKREDDNFREAMRLALEEGRPDVARAVAGMWRAMAGWRGFNPRQRRKDSNE